MPALAKRWTRAEVLALPADGNRYELVDGELLVTPAPGPRHQLALKVLYDRLEPYVREHRLGTLLWSPADLDFGRGYVVQPDLFVVSETDTRKLQSWHQFGVPIFIAEALSRSTGRYDRVIKRPAYQRAGVGTYWIVDVESRVVELWEPADSRPEICIARAVWRPDPVRPAFVLELGEYFGEVWGEGTP